MISVRVEGAPDNRQRGRVTVQSRERSLCCDDYGQGDARRTRSWEEEEDEEKGGVRSLVSKLGAAGQRPSRVWSR